MVEHRALDDEELEERDRVESRKIQLPEYCCPPTFRMHNTGDADCPHEWDKTETDDYVTWRCSKCPARAGCEVFD